MKKVDRIIIVGGGTSGWFAAAHFCKKFNVVLIDKETSERVGVGEATLVNFGEIMRRCGFSVSEWMPEVDGVYKAGILFKNWNRDEQDIWYPFLEGRFGGTNSSQVNLWSKCQDLDFKKYGSALYELSLNKEVNHNFGVYGYHIDCNLLVEFFKKKIAKPNCVEHIKSEVKEIIRSDDDSIQELILENGEKISGDLYLDCTGFKRLLSSNSDIVCLKDKLFCDTAVAGHVQYDVEKTELDPYVTCETVEHGWTWKIPVQSRLGTGLVFNRDITPIEEAKEYFCKYWNSRITPDQLKVLDWTPNYNKNIWNKNVVCIGLSAGFIEPLESTGIALITAGIQCLYESISGRSYHPSIIDGYNSFMKFQFETCVDFLNMHYYNSQKKGKFWDYVRNKHVINESHQFYADQMTSRVNFLPYDDYSNDTGNFNNTTRIFNIVAWYGWLIQLGYPIAPKHDQISEEDARIYLEEFYQKTKPKSNNET
jgi:tryptophan halogenase